MESKKSRGFLKPVASKKSPAKPRIILAKVILLTPFFAAFIWFSSLVMNKGTTTAAQLSPAKVDKLVTVLFIFILCYSAFLFYELRRMGKGHRKHKKR